MSSQSKHAQIKSLEKRIEQLKAQRQSPVERIGFPNGSSLTYRTMSDISQALANAQLELDALQTPSTKPRRARRVHIRMR